MTTDQNLAVIGIIIGVAMVAPWIIEIIEAWFRKK
jgi:hypothetical protein